MNLRAMLAGDLVLLVGPPMPERSMVRVQTKSSLPALRVMRLGCGLITHSPKKFYDYGNRERPYTPPLRCNEDDDDSVWEASKNMGCNMR